MPDDTKITFSQEALSSDELRGAGLPPIGVGLSHESIAGVNNYEGAVSIAARDREGKLIGYISGLPETSRFSGTESDIKDIYYVISVAVLPEYQSKGVGKELHDIIFNIVHKRGFKKVKNSWLGISM